MFRYNLSPVYIVRGVQNVRNFGFRYRMRFVVIG